MADQIITERPIKPQSGFNLNSYLLGLDADSYRILISDLAKKIVEDYSGSTLAGSAQAVKTALDSIDSTIGNAAMGTTATTITGAIAEHESDIGSVNAKIGNTAMGTTATTITGAIAEHENDISALNSKTADSGWLTLNSGIQYRKYHDVIYIYFNHGISLSTSVTFIGTLPEGYRPSKVEYFRLAGSSGSGNVTVFIYTDGTINAKVDSGTGTAINGFISIL